MTPEKVITIFQEAMKTACILSAPLLLSALFSGLIISFFQAATQINEQTLSFIPKIIFVLVASIIFGPWMLKTMMHYMEFSFTNFSERNI